MLSGYHVEVTDRALQAMGVPERNARILSQLSKSPDDVMLKPPMDIIEMPGGDLNDWQPTSTRKIGAAQERAIIRSALATKLQYRLDRCRQIAPIAQDPYVQLRYALHDAQKCRTMCRAIEQRFATQDLDRIRSCRFIGDYCHFAIDAVTPVHDYIFSPYLERPETIAGQLVELIQQDLARHAPYEQAMYENRYSEPRFEEDIDLLQGLLSKMAELPSVHLVLHEPIGFIQAWLL